MTTPEMIATTATAIVAALSGYLSSRLQSRTQERVSERQGMSTAEIARIEADSTSEGRLWTRISELEETNEKQAQKIVDAEDARQAAEKVLSEVKTDALIKDMQNNMTISNLHKDMGVMMGKHDVAEAVLMKEIDGLRERLRQSEARVIELQNRQ